MQVIYFRVVRGEVLTLPGKNNNNSNKHFQSTIRPEQNTGGNSKWKHFLTHPQIKEENTVAEREEPAPAPSNLLLAPTQGQQADEPLRGWGGGGAQRHRHTSPSPAARGSGGAGAVAALRARCFPPSVPPAPSRARRSCFPQNVPQSDATKLRPF